MLCTEVSDERDDEGVRAREDEVDWLEVMEDEVRSELVERT